MGRKVFYNKRTYGPYKTKLEQLGDKAIAETCMNEQSLEKDDEKNFNKEPETNNMEEAPNDDEETLNRENENGSFEPAKYYAKSLERLYEIYESKKSN